MQQGVYDDGVGRGTRTREQIMERRERLVQAHELLQSELRGDIENGFIDRETYTVLREATYQLINAIDCHNTVWHLEDEGHEYPNNDSSLNDWTYWDIRVTAPFSRANPMEMEYHVDF